MVHVDATEEVIPTPWPHPRIDCNQGFLFSHFLVVIRRPAMHTAAEPNSDASEFQLVSRARFKFELVCN